uniref:Uncharacterized protein n=1 Tax=Arundo donax TaxID=35708 RepID=A0A0A9F0X5_ARUDO
MQEPSKTVRRGRGLPHGRMADTIVGDWAAGGVAICAPPARGGNRERQAECRIGSRERGILINVEKVSIFPLFLLRCFAFFLVFAESLPANEGRDGQTDRG